MCEDLLQAYESKIVSHSVRLSNSYGMPKLKVGIVGGSFK